MSTAANPITEQLPEQRRGGKKSAEERISELIAENKSLKQDLSAIENECRRLTASDEARKQQQRTAMNRFISQCEAISKVQPGFDSCLRRLADIPESWLQE